MLLQVITRSIIVTSTSNNMKATETKLSGCFIIEPQIFVDSRGYFLESYNQDKLEKILNFCPKFVQDNQSRSTFGVVRGLHMQTGAHQQAKLVRVLEGEVLDIAVDVRLNSATFGQWIAVLLSSDNQKQLFIPKGFLHGFSVLSKNATFFYKCDNIYNKDSEKSVNPFDESLKIDWGVESNSIVLSEKDRTAQSFLSFTTELE